VHVNPFPDSSPYTAGRRRLYQHGISPHGQQAIYSRLTGKKLVFIDRLLTANLAISI